MSQVAPQEDGHKMLAFRADSEIVKALEEAAKKNDRSLSAEIRQAIRAYFELEAA